MTEQVKVSWKLGGVEMQYEGNEEFLKTELPKLFQQLLEIYKSGPKNGELEPLELPRVKENSIIENPNGGKSELSVNDIATQLGVKKGGQDFALAACGYLTLVEQKQTFSYEEIRIAMQSAHLFYDENQRKNLPKYIASLMKKRSLLERAPHVYAIEGAKLKELQKLLAN